MNCTCPGEAAAGWVPVRSGLAGGEMTVVVGVPEDFTLEAFRRVTVDGEGVVIGAAAVRVMGEARAGFERLLLADPGGFIYGVTTRPGVESQSRRPSHLQ